MSDQETRQVVGEIAVMRRFLTWFGGIVATGILAGGVVGLNDHFKLQSLVDSQEKMAQSQATVQQSLNVLISLQGDISVLRADRDYMKPKVEELWWKRNNPSQP